LERTLKIHKVEDVRITLYLTSMHTKYIMSICLVSKRYFYAYITYPFPKKKCDSQASEKVKMIACVQASIHEPNVSNFMHLKFGVRKIEWVNG
jgi:hypothetical protein